MGELFSVSSQVSRGHSLRKLGTESKKPPAPAPSRRGALRGTEATGGEDCLRQTLTQMKLSPQVSTEALTSQAFVFRSPGRSLRGGFLPFLPGRSGADSASPL